MDTIVIERDVAATMRDGTVLRADVYRPSEERGHPVILARTPYDKRGDFTPVGIDPRRAASAGYAVVLQDVRGRFASEGNFDPLRHEAADGHDSVEWAARQGWSDGNVGMTGASYAGTTQLLAAAEQPPHLRALFVIQAPHDPRHEWMWQGGAFHLGVNLLWALAVLAPDIARRQVKHGAASREDLAGLMRGLGRIDDLYARLPLEEQDLAARWTPFYLDWLERAEDDEYWRPWEVAELASRIAVPVFHVAGWYDVFAGGSIANYTALRARSSPSAAQKLLVGPWAHLLTTGAYAERDFGIFASNLGAGLPSLQLRWFDRWLKDDRNGVDEEPPVRIFVMGADSWRDEDEWPPARMELVPYFLRSGGRAGAAANDGRLTQDAAAEDEPTDSYVYDPRDPVPTAGGRAVHSNPVAASAGPRDQREIERRPDVLCYTSAPLEDDLEVTGPVRVVLYASTSAQDTDWTAKLVDVAPDGRATILADGIVRARYREGPGRARAVEPGAVHVYEIDLAATSNVFGARHRIRLEISSSSFPRFDRNANSGGRIGHDRPEDLRPATQSVHHTPEHRSHLLLPVVSAR